MIEEKAHRTPSIVFQENVHNICDAVSDADTYVLAKDFLNAGLISGPVEDDIMTNKSRNRLQRINTLLRDIRNLFKSSIVKEDELLSKICSVLHSQDNQALSQIADQMCKGTTSTNIYIDHFQFHIVLCQLYFCNFHRL